eukprot:5309896-Pyramimonas_sp.AAC.1
MCATLTQAGKELSLTTRWYQMERETVFRRSVGAEGRSRRTSLLRPLCSMHVGSRVFVGRAVGLPKALRPPNQSRNRADP